ncbi:MAG TPA: RNase adapter RapZ [Candidatus Sulfotelmatobacter sp.]|nr:RNase adapter RapZ [Candidatus Sulfotelmatobacter sp.]
MTEQVKAGGTVAIEPAPRDAGRDRPADAPVEARRAPVVLVTGMAGAGRSLALKVFEDLGYEAVDNLPISMLRMLIRTSVADRAAARGDTSLPPARPLALGIDTRTRGFSVEHLVAEAAALRARDDCESHLLFLDCDDDVLIRRFEETRRRHPLAADRPVSDGIQIERALLAPLREAADLVIDTSSLRPAELRALLDGRFGRDRSPGLTVTVMSFSFKLGLPREADLVFDVRFLKNPYYDPVLKPFDGRDPRVAAYIESDADFDRFWNNLTRLLEPLLPRFLAEGKSYLTLAVGCTGGRHRSVFLAERLAAWLNGRGFNAGISHRDVHRTAPAGAD